MISTVRGAGYRFDPPEEFAEQSTEPKEPEDPDHA
jgi:DNA-binding winged helix-turn-helix (wHTH) protein